MMIKLLKNSGKRCLVLLLFALLPAGSLWAQGLEVEKPLTLTTRQEAKTYERLDLNQVPCALLILHLNDDNVDFEGDIRTMQYRQGGEWWLWMIQGSNWLTVKSSKWSPLRLDFESMQSSKTYEMTLRPVMTLKLAITEPLRADISMQDASSTKWGRKDANGRTCALLRIGLVLPEAKFVGKWVVDSEYHDGEWYVWLSPDATQLTVTAEGYQALALEFDPVKASTTYVMTLLKEGAQRVKRTDGYVDLGLPSGTLWKEENEEDGFYSYGEAMSEFGNNVPTKRQWEELMAVCELKSNGQLIGPNGEAITLPAMGYMDCDKVMGGMLMACYWSSTSKGVNEAWAMNFIMSDDEIRLDAAERCFLFCVRLVKPSDKNQPSVPKSSTTVETKGYSDVSTNVVSNGAEYVDLGLPSGTLWKNENESGVYSYTAAMGSYGEQLPTKAQLEELVAQCTWTWENKKESKGFTITGPNGNSVFLPADGTQNCFGENSGKIGVWGGYWSCSVFDSEKAWNLGILSPKAAGKYLSPCSISNDKYCFGYSVRLVKSKR